MSYSPELYEKAIKILESTRNQNIRKCEERKKSFFLKNRRALEIEKLLSRTSIATAKAILNGKNCKQELTLLKNNNLKLQNELRDILISQNLPENYLEVQYTCDKCNDTGYIDGKICSCLKQILKNEAYKELNSLSPLSLSSFETFLTDYYSADNQNGGISVKEKMEKILGYCIKYSDNFSLNSDNLFMTGKTGLGKTHLSLAIANEVINKNFGVIYCSTPNILSKLERERFKRDTSFEDTEQHILKCDLLILDDLGTEFQTNFSNSTIYNIINSRILYKRPTIISTNYSIKEIQKNYSERLVSRIWGNFKLLNFIGNDIRSQIASQKAYLIKKKTL